MEKIPAIGGARGIFEIFVPGAFLLLNLATATHLWPFTADPVRDQLVGIYKNASALVLASITLGYLLGVVLRLLRSDMPDRLSAWFLRVFDRRTYGGETDRNRFAFEHFPFTKCLKTVCEEKMPANVLQFYETVWATGDSKHFFNFCKMVVSMEDERAAREMYAAESFCRHISGMFYALFASSIALLAVDVSIWISKGSPSFTLTVILVVYALAIVAILANFRFMRLKEVDTVFAASYRNRAKIADALGSTRATVTGAAQQADATGGPSGRR